MRSVALFIFALGTLVTSHVCAQVYPVNKVPAYTLSKDCDFSARFINSQRVTQTVTKVPFAMLSTSSTNGEITIKKYLQPRLVSTRIALNTSLGAEVFMAIKKYYNSTGTFTTVSYPCSRGSPCPLYTITTTPHPESYSKAVSLELYLYPLLTRIGQEFPAGLYARLIDKEGKFISNDDGSELLIEIPTQSVYSVYTGNTFETIYGTTSIMPAGGYLYPVKVTAEIVRVCYPPEGVVNNNK